MRFTIIGAGTIGLTYGHLLSRVHDVDYVVPDGRRSAYEGSFHLHLHDLRDGTDSVREFTPRLLSDVSASEADAILVMAPGVGSRSCSPTWRRRLRRIFPSC